MPVGEKEKTFDSSANERKYTQIKIYVRAWEQNNVPTLQGFRLI